MLESVGPKFCGISCQVRYSNGSSLKYFCFNCLTQSRGIQMLFWPNFNHLNRQNHLKIRSNEAIFCFRSHGMVKNLIGKLFFVFYLYHWNQFQFRHIDYFALKLLLFVISVQENLLLFFSMWLENKAMK